MKTDDIIEAAKKRLAEIDAERSKLLAMIEAVEGPKPIAPFIPVPQPMPFYPAQPTIPWHPHVPWPNDGVTCVATWTIDPVGTHVAFDRSYDRMTCSGVPIRSFTIDQRDLPVALLEGPLEILLPNGNERVIGGPQRMDLNVPFAS